MARTLVDTFERPRPTPAAQAPAQPQHPGPSFGARLADFGARVGAFFSSIGQFIASGGVWIATGVMYVICWPIGLYLELTAFALACSASYEMRRATR